MRISKLGLPGALLLEPLRHEDQRGWFMEVWNRRSLERQGVGFPFFLQENHSYSRDSFTLRGLHYQAPPRAQGKLVRCVRGAIRDVVVDARRGSPTFGHWRAAILTARNAHLLWIPAGFLHGFVTLESDTEVVYHCTEVYSPEHDGAVHWKSPALAIDWGITRTPVVSEKDARAPSFEHWDSPFEYAESRQ